MNRVLYIDNLKGLAIILVVMGHVSYISLGIDGTVFNASYISFHMPLFMFLSGIFAFHSFQNYNTQEVFYIIKKKFFRTIIPFTSVGVIYSLIELRNIYGHFLGEPGRLWFLPALFLDMLFGLGWLFFSSFIKKNTPPQFKNKEKLSINDRRIIGICVFFYIMFYIL